jgi:c-di-GMP-specific phosphodiesterase
MMCTENKNTEIFIRSFLSKIPVAVIILNEFDQIYFFNQVAEKMWGVKSADVEGLNLSKVMTTERILHDNLMQTKDSGAEQTLVVTDPDGTQLNALYVHMPVGISNGQRRYIVMFQYCSPKFDAEKTDNTTHYLLKAMNYANRPMLISNANRHIVYVNQAFTEMFGYSADDVIGRDPRDILPCPHLPEKDVARYRSLPWGAARFHTEMRLCSKNGHDLWTRIYSSPFLEISGDLVGYSVDVLQDLTDDLRIRDMERDVLQALTSSLSFVELGNYICNRIEKITSGVRVSVCCIEDNRMCPWAAPSFPEEYGAFFQNMEIGEGVASCGTAAHRGEPVMVRDIETDPLWDPYKHVMLPHGFRSCWTYPVKRFDDSVAATFAFYFQQGGEPNEYLEHVAEAGVHLCVLAIEREENRRALEQQVQFDTLTGLPNRSHMWQHLDAFLKVPGLERITVLILNINRFRDVNDALGHAAGDQVLLVLANRFHEQMEPEDLLGRVQGDQFLVISKRDHTRARWLEINLQEALQEPLEVSDQPINLTMSIGISRYPEDGQDCDTLLSIAEAHMKTIKNGNRSLILYNSESGATTQNQLLISSALKHAIDHGGLSLYYQPQVLADTKQIHGVEALARWYDSKLGHIPPDQFIALAEETGQIDALSRWALRQACQQLTEWRANGIHIPTVSVNLSAVNFQKTDLPEFVEDLLCEFSLPGSCLTIEITESSTVALTPKMEKTLSAIRNLGVGLSVDDFGTGYSSLTNLVRLPITEVKIDRSFIDKILEDDRLRFLVLSVIELGRNLGLVVVAEGVETSEQYHFLRKCHCQVIQGYFFSRPLTSAQAGDWFSTRIK